MQVRQQQGDPPGDDGEMYAFRRSNRVPRTPPQRSRMCAPAATGPHAEEVSFSPPSAPPAGVHKDHSRGPHVSFHETSSSSFRGGISPDFAPSRVHPPRERLNVGNSSGVVCDLGLGLASLGPLLSPPLPSSKPSSLSTATGSMRSVLSGPPSLGGVGFNKVATSSSSSTAATTRRMLIPAAIAHSGGMEAQRRTTSETRPPRETFQPSSISERSPAIRLKEVASSSSSFSSPAAPLRTGIVQKRRLSPSYTSAGQNNQLSPAKSSASPSTISRLHHPTISSQSHGSLSEESDSDGSDALLHAHQVAANALKMQVEQHAAEAAHLAQVASNARRLSNSFNRQLHEARRESLNCDAQGLKLEVWEHKRRQEEEARKRTQAEQAAFVARRAQLEAEVAQANLRVKLDELGFSKRIYEITAIRNRVRMKHLERSKNESSNRTKRSALALASQAAAMLQTTWESELRILALENQLNKTEAVLENLTERSKAIQGELERKQLALQAQETKAKELNAQKQCLVQDVHRLQRAAAAEGDKGAKKSVQSTAELRGRTPSQAAKFPAKVSERREPRLIESEERNAIDKGNGAQTGRETMQGKERRVSPRKKQTIENTSAELQDKDAPLKKRADKAGANTSSGSLSSTAATPPEGQVCKDGDRKKASKTDRYGASSVQVRVSVATKLRSEKEKTSESLKSSLITSERKKLDADAGSDTAISPKKRRTTPSDVKRRTSPRKMHAEAQGGLSKCAQMEAVDSKEQKKKRHAETAGIIAPRRRSLRTLENEKQMGLSQSTSDKNEPPSQPGKGKSGKALEQKSPPKKPAGKLEHVPATPTSRTSSGRMGRQRSASRTLSAVDCILLATPAKPSTGGASPSPCDLKSAKLFATDQLGKSTKGSMADSMKSSKLLGVKRGFLGSFINPKSGFKIPKLAKKR